MEFIVKKIKPADYKLVSEVRELEKKCRKEGVNGRSIKENLARIGGQEILADIINKQVEIDIENIERFKEEGNGFGMERFPASFKETLVYFCREYGAKWNEKELQEAYNIGKGAFLSIKKNLYPGVIKTLKFLTLKGDELILFTKGDFELQKKKIKVNKLERWFSEVHIVDNKNKHLIQNMTRKRNKKKTYMVGNSIRSDINPAIEAGIRAIYIPCETWKYEGLHNGLKKRNVLTLNKLEEIIEKYEKL